MKTLILFFSGLAVLLQGCSGRSPDSELPNIVIILADDMGWGDPGCYDPGSKVSTPHIDRLAREGMRFTDAHSESAVCTPTRYSILTGRYAWRTRLKKGVLWAWDKPLIKKGRLTLPAMLKQKGYRTAAIGKWHLGWDWPVKDSIPAKKTNGENVDYSRAIKGGPLAVGFDHYFGDDVPNFPPYTFIENERVTVVPTEDKPDSLFGHKGKMAPGWKLEGVMPGITRHSVEFITQASKDRSKPFFLYFALTAPHTPIAPSREFKGTTEAGAYGDYVREVDWVVGRIAEALRQNGVENNTVLIFTSDNGSPARNGRDWSGPVGSVIKDFGHYPNGKYRGLKGDAWEGGHRVPLIVRWPGRVEEGTRSDALVTSMDLMAVIAGIVGYELPPNSSEDGISFLDVLTGRETKAREFLVNHSFRGVFAIRKGKWKLILSNRSGGFSDGLHPGGYGIETPGQLYNLETDPYEKDNLYARYPERVEELTRELEKIKQR